MGGYMRDVGLLFGASPIAPSLKKTAEKTRPHGTDCLPYGAVGLAPVEVALRIGGAK